MKNKLALIILFGLCLKSAYAHDLPIVYHQKISANEKEILEKAFNEVSHLLPNKLKNGLPTDIEITIDKNSTNQKMPGNDICQPNKLIEKNNFVFGSYHHLSNRLILNIATVLELAKKKEDSLKINCQHGTLYNQAISTIVHELTHAYDYHQNYLSKDLEFLARAGFKKGFLKIKNKNINALRSPDEYELKNSQEAFAVNMEYFTMDSEYACRKPALFAYYKKLLEVDPFPLRSCELNQTVMVSGAEGYSSIKLDLNRIYRIDYLMARPGTDLSSGFGHSMFRIIMCAPERYDLVSKKIIPQTPLGPECLEDTMFHLVVSYRANVEEATLNYYKGIFGGYPSTLFILNFADVIDQYTKDELRDVISYPLNLTTAERSEFITKVIEEHWNYRGAYKFFTNNCAVESESLLKASLDTVELLRKKSLTPNGVLEDLDKLNLVDLKSNTAQKYNAKTDQLLKAYKTAYNYQESNNVKTDKQNFLYFINTSRANDRLGTFTKNQITHELDLDLHSELLLMKEKMIKLSSYAVIEQQILRSFSAVFKKRAVELFLNTNEKIDKTIKIDFKDLTSAGYGVPLTSEMISDRDLKEKQKESKSKILEFEKIAKVRMATEFKIIDDVSGNIARFNDATIKMRKQYREKLLGYIHQVIHNLSLEDGTREVLVDIKNGDTSRIKELRELLDAKLVNQSEILDEKLINFVTQELTKEVI